MPQSRPNLDVKSSQKIVRLAPILVKRRGIKLGNPNLSNVRNTDTKSANNVRVKKADIFALEVTEIIKEIYRKDGFTRSVDITSALNARGIKTSHWCEWTSVQVLRIANWIATIESRE